MLLETIVNSPLLIKQIKMNALEDENKEKELFRVVYSAIPYNIEDIVLPDYVREEIADQIVPEIVKLFLDSKHIKKFADWLDDEGFPIPDRKLQEYIKYGG